MAGLLGDANNRAIGPRMRDLRPQHREFVKWYCQLRNATRAARKAGYKDNGTNSIRVMASRLMDRDDIARAITEEALRRMRCDMPVHLELVRAIADGSAAQGDDRPVAHSTRLKALDLLVAAGGGGPRVQVEHTGEIVVTVRERWEKIARMAAARGESPEALLANLPEQDRRAILVALERPVDAEFEEVQPQEDS